METFIARTARWLYGKYGDEVTSLSILLPSRRARLFMTEALAEICGKPIWQPSYMGMDELMSEISGQRATDGVRLTTELYKIWSRYHHETFDSFYYWGEMLLADFDAIDKYLIDAGVLFSNMCDLKVLESDHSYMSPKQRDMVRQFWESFTGNEGVSGEQEQFIRIWDTLAPIYRDYRLSLASQGMAYTGMMHRTAAEKIGRGEVEAGVADKK